VKPTEKSKQFADLKELDNGKQNKSLKVKIKRRSKANVNKSEDVSDKSGGLKPG
jgi:hypothetical protein